MPTAFDKLEKILKLEESQGYRNRAVIGGLDKFAEIWQEEAEAEIDDEQQITEVKQIADLLQQYTDIDKPARVQLIDDILSRLSQPARPRAVPRQPPLRKPGTLPDDTPQPVPAQVPTAPLSAKSEAQRLSGDTTPLHGLDAPVSSLPGISAAYSARLKQLDIETVGDLLYHVPHRYDDYSTLKPINRLEYGEETTVIGTIWETGTRKTRGGGTIVTSVVADASGTIEAVWFNQPYLTRQLRAGRQIVLSGKVSEHLGRLTLQSPEWEPLERELIHTARLVPVYPLTRGIGARWMRRMMKRVVDHWAPRLHDHLPVSIRERVGMVDLPTAIRQIHFPNDQQAAQAARRRLAFDEFFFLQLGMLAQRQKWQSQTVAPIPRNEAMLSAFLGSLPFDLTEAQHRALDQILEDMGQPYPMSRLLQGDVGSGKTVVALASMLMAVAEGRQAALMAPTEILVEQHHQTITELLNSFGEQILGRPISVVLLTGSLRRVQRGKVYSALASGQADIVVGTHALIQRHVTFQDLGLVIVDEQHRFGVRQRADLRDKGFWPHMLVMSATPIPRSLALTIYGDLEISVIEELPPGRQSIETRWLLPQERERAYAFLRSQIENGRQAFMLYPLIEESESIDARSATEEYERLQEMVFSDLRLGLLHGRMKASDKEGVMEAFRQGELDILVSTSVVEVGIDVPNATVMLIEGADRFGLAQLHQFRGRVGRGSHRSYCLLVSDAASPDDPETKTTWERLRAIEETQDGFVLAEKDLALRGPGDFFGVRQSGLPALRLAGLGDMQILERAREEAKVLFDTDPELEQLEHQALAEAMVAFWRNAGEPN